MSERAAAVRPRLLVTASTYPRWAGDPEPGFVHELAKRLVRDFDVTVLAPHAPGAAVRETLDGVDVVRWRYAPVRWETLVHGGGIGGNLKRHPAKALLLPGFVLGQAFAAWRLLSRWRPDVVHAHWLIPQGVVLWALSAVRRVPPWLVTSHGADLFTLRGAPWRALKRRVLRAAAAATVVSSAMREELARIGADGAVAVEPMGVDLRDRFRPDATTPRACDRLLFVGRLVEKKGVRFLLDALPAVIAARPDARLCIIGFGPELAALETQVAAAGLDGHVEFAGAVAQADLPDRYRRATVFVAPFVRGADGDQEGLGLVLAEAAGCGCPVVAGDVPAVRDVIVSPEVGTIVDARSPMALARVLVAALARAPDRGEEARRAAAVAGFDWDARAAAYAGILRGLTAREPVGGAR